MNARGNRTPRARGALAAASLVVAGTLGLLTLEACADFDPVRPAAAPDTLVAAPSFTRDIQPIFTARCATVSCHTVITQQRDLALESPAAYDEIVNVVSQMNPPMRRIRPFDADSSWLVRLIQSDGGRRHGVARMPLGRPPLTDRQIGTIVNWVLQGAPRN